jgi:hypothetical protein
MTHVITAIPVGTADIPGYVSVPVEKSQSIPVLTEVPYLLPRFPATRTAALRHVTKRRTLQKKYGGSQLRNPASFGWRNTIQKQTPWPLVRKRTIQTERLPLVHEI